MAVQVQCPKCKEHVGEDEFVYAVDMCHGCISYTLAAVTAERDRLVKAVDRYILASQRWDELTGRDPDEWSYVGGELESAREHLATLAASIKGDTDPTPPA